MPKGPLGGPRPAAESVIRISGGFSGQPDQLTPEKEMRLRELVEEDMGMVVRDIEIERSIGTYSILTSSQTFVLFNQFDGSRVDMLKNWLNKNIGAVNTMAVEGV